MKLSKPLEDSIIEVRNLRLAQEKKERKQKPEYLQLLKEAQSMIKFVLWVRETGDPLFTEDWHLDEAIRKIQQFKKGE
jgi:hypothetical protein